MKRPCYRRCYYAAALALGLLMGCHSTDSPPSSPVPQTLYPDMLAALNFARTDPQGYAEQVLIPMRPYYRQGRIWQPPWYDPQDSLLKVVETDEGIAALEETIRFMQQAQPVAPLALDDGLSRVASDYRQAQARNGGVGHIGDDGSTLAVRIERLGQWQGKIGENLFYGSADRQVGAFVVMALLIDDGVPDRGHRLLIMDPAFRLVGLACGPHRSYPLACVQNFATEFTPDPAWLNP
ncbi:CAP domain-containing protein [Ferrimonas marina]|uniref:SCP domain-containing protein n=1 Tax=Ferrimonas marina TaxID=299255 RepID=A0A1M5NYR5_9GAMM|nr:CAP domain-containing protein [Ferrimonas marina]SHG94661.1 hypothetical protein SAMN02745129_1227 [Ferrimonas marina]